MDKSGAASLAQVISDRIASQTKRPDILELGVIQGDMSLKLDQFSIPMPKGEYLIADWLARLSLPSFSIIGTETSPVDDQGVPLPGATTTTAQYELPSQDIDKVHIAPKPDIQPGDRVLVAWVNDGTDPVILCRVVSS